jgi:carbon storage regulator
MLVLTRKVGEQLIIGDGVVIRVVGARGRKVRIGIEAPPEIPIRRSEPDVDRGAELVLSVADLWRSLLAPTGRG